MISLGMFFTASEMREPLGNIPFVYLLATPAPSMDQAITGTPLAPSYIPTFAMDVTELDTFWDRLWECITLLQGHLAQPFIFFEPRNQAREDLNLTKLSLFEAFFTKVKPASMVIYFNFIGLSRAFFYSPSVFFIGSMNRVEKPLEKRDELIDWVNDSPDPVIFATFSTAFKVDPPNLAKIFNVFKGLERVRILWSLPKNSMKHLPITISEVNEEVEAKDGTKGTKKVIKTGDVSPHMRITAWVNQIEVLKSEKVAVVFGTGGMDSITENFHYGSHPMLCIPMFMEQNVNCRNVERYGAGIRISRYEVTEENLKSSLFQLMNNETYQEKAAHFGVLLKVSGGTDRAIELIESLVKVGNAEHLVPRSFYMPDYQVLNLDFLVSSLE